MCLVLKSCSNSSRRAGGGLRVQETLILFEFQVRVWLLDSESQKLEKLWIKRATLTETVTHVGDHGLRGDYNSFDLSLQSYRKGQT